MYVCQIGDPSITVIWHDSKVVMQDIDRNTYQASLTSPLCPSLKIPDGPLPLVQDHCLARMPASALLFKIVFSLADHPFSKFASPAHGAMLKLAAALRLPALELAWGGCTAAGVAQAQRALLQAAASVTPEKPALDPCKRVQRCAKREVGDTAINMSEIARRAGSNTRTNSCCHA